MTHSNQISFWKFVVRTFAVMSTKPTIWSSFFFYHNGPGAFNLLILCLISLICKLGALMLTPNRPTLWRCHFGQSCGSRAVWGLWPILPDAADARYCVIQTAAIHHCQLLEKIKTIKERERANGSSLSKSFRVLFTSPLLYYVT